MEIAAMGRGHAEPPAARFVWLVTALSGLSMLGAGLWSLVAPRSFARFVDFPPYNAHFLHDLGAFQIGLGAILLLAVLWSDALAVALAGFLVANTVHAVNHAMDLNLGGHRSDWIGLAALSVALAAALIVRLRQLGWVVGRVSGATIAALEPFVRQKTVVLTSFRKDGTPVGVPVSIAVEGDHAFIRSPEKGWKVKRMRNNPLVEVAPSTARGRPTGSAIRAHARELTGREWERAGHLLRRKHPFLQGLFVPAIHRSFRGKIGRTIHFELVPVDSSTGPGPRLRRQAFQSLDLSRDPGEAA